MHHVRIEVDGLDCNAPNILTRSLEGNIEVFQALLHADVNTDAQFRRFICHGRALCLIYIEGMADAKKIAGYVLRACAESRGTNHEPLTVDALINGVLEIPQCGTESGIHKLLNAVVTGMSMLLIDGEDQAVLLETRGYPARAVGKTTNESVVIGAQEGFVESLRTNMTLLRRYLSSPDLVTESLTVGTQVPCQIVLAYLQNTAENSVVEEVRTRIMKIDMPVIQGLGAVQQLIEDQPNALLPQMLQTERPDRAVACLADGQVVILADNSPFALAAPVTLFHQLHASDDTFSRWQYGTFLRLIRVMGILISLFLPGLYLALADYHTHLLPLSLLGSISEARANVPFPILVEILIMEFSFYLINEAGTRMPQQIGSALGIVGALILGQAAVSASIISPILIIIVALTGLGNYAVPDYGFSIGLILYRLIIILASAALGLYGFCIALFCMVLGLCGMKSLGIPYLAPVAPFRSHNPDILLRLPIRLQRKRMFFADLKAGGRCP